MEESTQFYTIMTIQSAETVKNLMQAFLQKGFTFEYFHQKGGDSSCVYVYRFKKGKSFFDWRETSGTNELHFVVCRDGEYLFPVLEKRQPQAFRTLKWRIFKKPTMDEKRAAFAAALNAELAAADNVFFGIPL